jgi:hypothetical protein
VSIAPGHTVPTTAASGPKGAPFAYEGLDVPDEIPLGTGEPRIRMVDVLRLQPGDRLIIHADGEQGLGPGGAHQIARQAHEMLRLGELPFDVPVVVSAPGLRIEVLRPT